MRDFPRTVRPRFSRAVFLDRDGTINIDTHYPHKEEELTLIPEAVEGLKLIASLPVHIIVVSNQSGIALGLYTKEQMSRFNKALRDKLEHEGVRIDAFYYCPHLEGDSNPGCECSKPLPGLLLEAAGEFRLQLSECYMVGDKRSDVLAGKRADCRKSILVRTGKSGSDREVVVTPDDVVDDLQQAAKIIVGDYPGEK